MKKRVVVGLSGGVDSSVAAHILVEQGYDVIGMYMRNWHDQQVVKSQECPWIDDANDALLVAQQLGIPFQVIDLSKEYKERIVDYMFREYQAGRTPNPDILCNREIKFDVFLKAATELGADYVATGHYCQKKENKDGSFALLRGKDPNKDQSYFLCQITQNQLAKALFPIGNLLKNEVRAIAQKIKLVTAQKKDSQGLCFVGKISLPIFLQQQLAPKNGDIIEIPSNMQQFYNYNSIPKTKEMIEKLAEPFKYKHSDGIKVGEHIGAHYYTIGQRKGLHIGGRPQPSFVIAIDTNNNIVYTGQNEKHPGLNRIALFVSSGDVNYINEAHQLKDGETLHVLAHIRYRQKAQEATLFKKSKGLYVLFNELQRGISPGQFVAFYKQNELIGSGVINH